MIWYVDQKAAVNGDGSAKHPFKKIQQAAEKAQAGDEILVEPGIYHEEVSPVYAGTKEKPIVYRSRVERGAVISGAERFDNWEKVSGDVWKLAVPNTYFGSCNPYTTLVWGDWLSPTFPCHTGEVYLNGKSLYERESLEQVMNPVIDDTSWDKDFTLHTWYTCQGVESDETIIYANFGALTPTANR